jgi:hypothetical protein
MRRPHLPFLIGLLLAAASPVGADPAFYSWTGPSGGAWGAAANWFPARTSPAADDRLVFQTGTSIAVTAVPTTTIGQIAVLNGTQVTFLGNSPVVNTVTFTGGLGDDLDIRAGCSLALTNPNRIVLQLATGTTARIAGEFRTLSSTHRLQSVDAGAIVFPSGGVARTINGFMGSMFGPGNASSAAGSVHFEAGSIYHHCTTADDPFGTAAGAVAVFEPGSLFRILSNNVVIANGRTFANVEASGGAGGFAELRGTVGCTMDTLVVTSGTVYLSHSSETTIRGQLHLAPGARLVVGPTSGTGSLRFAGTVEQVLDGNQEIPSASIAVFVFQPNLTVVIDNPAGVRFPGDDYPTAPFDMGTVELVRGVFHLDNFTALRLLHPVTGGSDSSWIHARVHRYLPPGFEAEMIPLGSASGFTPLSLVFQGSLADTVIVSAVVQSPGDPPISPLTDSSFVGAQLDTTKRVNLLYHLSFFDETTTVPPPMFGVELGFRPANVGPGADWENFIPRMRSIGTAGDMNVSWRSPSGILLARAPDRIAMLNLQGDHPSDYAFVFAVGEPSVVSVTVQDPAAEEGGEALRTGTGPDGTGASLAFRVSLSEPAVETITVDYETAAGSAEEGADFTPGSGTLTFLPGDTVKVVEVPILGEGDAENHETLSLLLSNATGAVIADGEGEGTILDDDDVEAPSVTVLTPNGGETVIENSTVDLQWVATDNVVVATVDLLLSKDGGGTWETIATEVANTGSYAWQAPVGLTQQALLRAVARDHRDQADEDVSDAVWSIWGVDEVEPTVPLAFALDLASANPSRGPARVRLAMPREQSVRADVYNIVGRRVATLVDGTLPAGVHHLEWRGEGVAAGLYFVDLVTAGFRARERVVRLP